ncbi:uncharacterized protein LOC134848705 [Symsagittifera roscoffensis]|uniref:uncharacterized protein LOC134848705 n=1 Tax=Symsagittifera roscoffensis TaxID=84072 RepID=UPI00307B4C11
METIFEILFWLNFAAGRGLRACFICGDRLVEEEPLHRREVSFPSSQHIRSNDKLLGDFAFLKVDEIVGEMYCGNLCVFNTPCKSYNFNTAVKQCQLLATDLHLKNITSIETNTNGIWIHRSLNNVLSRGCRNNSVILSDCVNMWVESVTTHEMVIVWVEPSDEDEDETQFLIVMKLGQQMIL